MKGHLERRSDHFIFRFAPEDRVLADYGLETLESIRAALDKDLGFSPSRPIVVDILRSSSDLAAMTTLSEDEVERTGTVAVSKWTRIMLTTPRAMRLGYEWQADSSRLTRDGSETGGFSVSHLHLATDRLAPGLELDLTVRNLFDKRHAHPAADSNWQNVIEQDGRSLRIALGARF